MTPHLIELAENYKQAGTEIHDAIRTLKVSAAGVNSMDAYLQTS